VKILPPIGQHQSKFGQIYRAGPTARRMLKPVGVNPRAEQLKKRTKRFALDVLQFARTLPATDDARAISRQLIRAATGVAANYRSACRSRSHSEFVARIGVALDEADESALWLEIITEGRISLAPRAFELLDEANQLSAILAQSRITATETLARGKTRRDILVNIP
jgi:four helix bundle protein